MIEQASTILSFMIVRILDIVPKQYIIGLENELEFLNLFTNLVYGFRFKTFVS